MNKGINNLIWTVVGACIGASATYVIVKKKYEDILETEIQSVKDSYNKMAKDLADKNESEKKRIILETTNQITGYLQESSADGTEEVLETEENEEPEEFDEEVIVKTKKVTKEKPHAKSMNSFKGAPEIISEDDYGSEDEFNLVTLYYLAENGDILDEDHDLIEDPASLIGEENMAALPDKFESDDCVYVRNFQRQCDYEVLLEE